MLRFLALLPVLLTLSAGAQQLRLNLRKGATYRQVTTSDVLVEQKMGNQKMSVRTIVEGSMAFRVLEVTGTGYRMEAMYEYLRHTTNMNGREETVDSRHPADSSKSRMIIMNRIFAAIIGQPIGVVMTRSGRVVSVSGAEKMWRTVVDRFPEIGDSTKEAVLAQALQSHSDSAVASSIQTATHIFPEHGKPGNGWMIVSEGTGALPVRKSGSWRLAASTGNGHLVVGETQVATFNHEPRLQPNGARSSIFLSGRQTARLHIDRRTGWIIEGTIKMKLEGETRILPDNRQPKGMVIPLTSTSETKLKS